MKELRLSWVREDDDEGLEKIFFLSHEVVLFRSEPRYH